MPHFPHAPEALLGRNDSKNAATTCRGITSSGRACRRALAMSKSPAATRNASALYCWQHKDQAEETVYEPDTKRDDRSGAQQTSLPPLRERSSLDTLVQKLGIGREGPQTKQTVNPPTPQHTGAHDFAGRKATSRLSHRDDPASCLSTAPQSRRNKPGGFWASLCCMSAQDDNYVEIVRHRKRMEEVKRPVHASTASVPAYTPRASHTPVSNRRPSAPMSGQHTHDLLSLIPSSLPATTASALLAELVKPLSPYDAEGYIYIFWLTPQSKTPPTESTARSLLSPHQPGRPHNGRRISDVMTEYLFNEDDETTNPKLPRHRHGSSKPKPTMLKIGRANNITRRMNEWQRQCGYALNLVRWYPYVPSNIHTSPEPPPRNETPRPLYPDLSPQREGTRPTVHKCPHIHRVERLIHLELAGKQAKWNCASCGKEHREWFEVEATQAAVRAVDETVRRWVGWAERWVESE